MLRARRSPAPLLAFAVSALGIYGVAVLLVSRLASLDDPNLVAWGLTLDLTLLVPLLYYLLLVRWRGWPTVTVLPVFIVSVLLAERLIPAGRQQVLDLVGYAAMAAELVVVGFIGFKVWQLRRGYREGVSAGLDVHDALRESAVGLLGPAAGGALAYEAAVFHYALTGWRGAPEPSGSRFSSHREAAYGAIVSALVLVVVVETAGIHWLVWMWKPVVAWVLTALSIYTLVWLIGDTHAIRHRLTEVGADELVLRLGLRWTARIPREAIEEIESVTSALPRKTPRYLKAVPIGDPNRRIRLSRPVEAVGPYGLRREITTVDVRIDDVARFDREFESI